MFSLVFLTLIGIVESTYLINCDHYTTEDTCIDRNLCKWCNITTNNTITNKCQYGTWYVVDNSSECVYSDNYRWIITMINIIINLILVMIFFLILSYIISISDIILEKYFASSTNDDVNRRKEKSIIVTIISFTVFLPAILLIVFDFRIFIIYFLFMLIFTIIISCSINTKKLLEESKKSSYNEIK